MAILDADKEGFLRSTRSLIQTIGRAARNLNGKAILYADRITDSMRAAIGETERRRIKQQEFNAEHGIVPTGLKKKIVDIMQVSGMASEPSVRQVAEAEAFYHPESPEALAKRIKQLEGQMYDHARNLEFEQAASLRDQIQLLHEQLFRE